MTGERPGPWAAYRLRWMRRRLIWRAIRARRQLVSVQDRTGLIRAGSVPVLATVRNERARMPHFLDHYRALGAGPFLIVDNDSDDGTGEYLSSQADVSLWRTASSYRAARFGMDWIMWLLFRHGNGRWCLTVDADELLVYPHHESRPVAALAAQLDAQGARALPALMLELYPDGPLGSGRYSAADDPVAAIPWFDADGYRQRRQQPMGNAWVQGGVRDRAFYADAPDRAPTLNKFPLVKWSRHYAYVTSTHALLPPRLNRAWPEPGEDRLSGVLLHTKFLPMVTARAVEEKARGEHFARAPEHAGYYDAVAAGPVLWRPTSTRYEDWRQLEALGLLSRGGWD